MAGAISLIFIIVVLTILQAWKDESEAQVKKQQKQQKRYKHNRRYDVGRRRYVYV